MTSQIELGPKSGLTVFQGTELGAMNSLCCSGGFERSEVILQIILFNVQQVNIDSLSCKHLISLEQPIQGDEKSKY